MDLQKTKRYVGNKGTGKRAAPDLGGMAGRAQQKIRGRQAQLRAAMKKAGL